MPKIVEGQIKPAEFIRTLFHAAPEAGTTLDDILEPGFWVHVAKALRTGSRIEVRPVGAAWLAELYVMSIDPVGVHTALLVKYDLAQVRTVRNKAREDGFQVKFGGQDKWRVIRLSDKTVVAKGMDTEAEAQLWVKDHVAKPAEELA